MQSAPPPRWVVETTDDKTIAQDCASLNKPIVVDLYDDDSVQPATTRQRWSRLIPPSSSLSRGSRLCSQQTAEPIVIMQHSSYPSKLEDTTRENHNSRSMTIHSRKRKLSRTGRCRVDTSESERFFIQPNKRVIYIYLVVIISPDCRLNANNLFYFD